MPTIKNLYIKYGDEIKKEKINMENISQLDSIIKSYIINNNFNEQNFSNMVSLSIDAFSFKSFETTVMTKERKAKTVIYNNGFIFLLAPVDYRLPVKILHIEKHSNGNYNQNMDEIATKIIETLRKHGLRTYFKCTDGDRFLSKEHENFFNKFVRGRSSNFLNLVKQIYFDLTSNKSLVLPVGDPLHLWKALRRRFQIHPMVIFKDSLFATDFELAKQIFCLGPPLNDTSYAGKMRDIYCLQLFNFENVYKLLEEGDFIDSTFFFFSFSCWIIVIFSTSIDLSFRLF